MIWVAYSTNICPLAFPKPLNENSAITTFLGVESLRPNGISISQNDYDDGTETTRRQLLSACGALSTAGDSLEGLLDVWKGVVQRVYHYYQLSATAYFKFLKLNGGVSVCTNQTFLT